jgi:Glycosyltransferase family 87
MVCMTANPKLKLVLVSYLLGAITLHALFFWIVRKQAMEGYPDFSIFYTAGKILRRGESSRLYDDALQEEIQREFAPLVTGREGPLPYNHPPFEAVLYVPLAYLSYVPAYALWVLLNFLLLVEICRFLRPYVPTLTAFWPWWPWLIGLGFSPAAFALMHGQDSVLLLLAYSLAFISLRDGKDFRAGLFLGLGLFKFHLVLPFAFILLLRRKWRVVGGFLVTAAAAGLVSVAVVGWKEMLYYPHYVWQVNRLRPVRVIVPRNMPNIRGLIEGWPLHVPTSWMDGLTLICSLAVLTWAASRWNVLDRECPLAWNGGFSIAVVATFLASYHVYNQDMSIVLLPVLLLLDQLLTRWVGGWRSRALAFCLCLLFFSPLYLILTLRYQHQNLFSLLLLGFAAAIATWVTAVRSEVLSTPTTAR